MASWTEVVSKVTTEGLEEEAREWASAHESEVRAKYSRANLERQFREAARWDPDQAANLARLDEIAAESVARELDPRWVIYRRKHEIHQTLVAPPGHPPRVGVTDVLVALADGLMELRAELVREREARQALEERVASLQTELARSREARVPERQVEEAGGNGGFEHQVEEAVRAIWRAEE